MIFLLASKFCPKMIFLYDVEELPTEWNHWVCTVATLKSPPPEQISKFVFSDKNITLVDHAMHTLSAPSMLKISELRQGSWTSAEP